MNDLEISHNWGDPREPQYNDVGRLAFATCRKGNTSLWLNIIPRKTFSGQVIWVVVAPAGIRNFANGSFETSIDICNKVIQYLSQERVKKEFQSSKQETIEFLLDTEDIPSGIRWLPHKMAGIRERNLRLFMLLPEIYAALLLGIGYAIAFLGLIIEIDPDHQLILRAATYIAASLALIRLSTEILKDYGLSMYMAKFNNKNRDVGRAAMSIMIRAWGVRYFATASLAGTLISIVGNNG